MPGVTTAYQTGVHGSRPAANAGCILYSCTTHGLVYRSDGTTWTTWLTLPSGVSSAAPGLTFSTTNSAGAASTYVATDATLAIFDATAPVTQAYSDTAAAGSAGVAARRDHKHGMPAASAAAFRGAKVYKSGSATLSDSAETVVTYNTEEYDTNTLHDTSTNAGRIVLDTVGYWRLTACGIWTANTTGRRMLTFRLNANGVGGAGTAVRGEQWAAATASGQARVTGTAIVKTSATTDYAETFWTQTSGGNLDILADSSFSAELIGV